MVCPVKASLIFVHLDGCWPRRGRNTGPAGLQQLAKSKRLSTAAGRVIANGASSRRPQEAINRAGFPAVLDTLAHHHRSRPATWPIRSCDGCLIRKPSALSLLAVFSGSEWIEHDRAEACDVTIIGCDERQAIGHGGRRKQAVDDGDRPDSAHSSPLVGDRIVDAQDATVERGLDLP